MSEESSSSDECNKCDSDWWLQDGIEWAEGGTPLFIRAQPDKNNIIYGRTRGENGTIEVLLNASDGPIPPPPKEKKPEKKEENCSSDAMTTQQICERIDSLECKLDCIAQELKKYCEEKNKDEEQDAQPEC